MIIVGIFVLGFGTELRANNNNPDTKTLLVLNSYHEDELWGNGMVEPIILHLAQTDSVNYDVMYLNGSTIHNLEAYNTVCDHVFSAYSEKKPDYVVMVGNFAFNLRDKIKENWGDIPFLLLSRTEEYGTLNDYFVDNRVGAGSLNQISDQRKDYNFTAVIMPDYYKANIDLMVDLIPDMDKVVFLADRNFVNKLVCKKISTYLGAEYPAMKFKWMEASQQNLDSLEKYLAYPQPRTGLLLSSWVYEIEGTRGNPVLTTKDLLLIRGAVNPVFTLRESYLELGAMGGVFVDNNEVKKDVMEIVESMLRGESMRDMPFYYPNKEVTKINYAAFKKFKMDEKDCPSDTIFYNRPLTWWEEYWWMFLIVALLAGISIFLLVAKNSEQKKQIALLDKHSKFIHNMPVPYAKAKLHINDKNKLVDLKFDIQSPTYKSLIEKNALMGNALYLLPTELIEEKIGDVINGEKSIMFSYHFDATDTYYEFLFYPVEIKDNVIEVDVFAMDITHHQKMEEALKKTAETLDMTINISKLVPYQWNCVSDTISFASMSFNSRLKGTKDTISEMPFEDFLERIYHEDSEIVKDIYNQVTKGKMKEFVIEFRLLMTDDETGEEKVEWCENHGAVTEQYDNGMPKMVTGSTQIITERKKQEELMAKALDKANESDRMKSAFLANMSHEIRTPLNAIVGFSGLLVHTQEENKRAELAKVINKNNDLLLNLINDVLDLAKIESNTIDLNYSVCDINDVVDSIAKTMSIRIPRGVRLNVVHYSDECVVETDSSRLAQILINLLTNACKFTSRGNITIGHEVIENDGMIYFFVKDTGIGIAPENQDKVFQQFIKLNNFVQGTGLGLAICKNLVAKLGGEIGVESAGVGRGSTFWFTIPYVPKVLEDNKHEHHDQYHDHHETSTEIKNELNEERKPIAHREWTDSNERVTIMIAEDNESNYWLLEHMLQDQYDLLRAQNGQEAVELYKKYHPDIVIMDINMPIMDGYEAVNEIRKISETVPIIAVTAYAFASDRTRILNSGFNAYVSKPISETSIMDPIHDVYDDNYV